MGVWVWPDLKPENIVKFSYEHDALTRMKLIDFDSAIFTGMRAHLPHDNPLKHAPTGSLTATTADARLLCTLQYFSPELARHVTHKGGVAGTGHAALALTKKHDVWQFGIILARMVGLDPMLRDDVALDGPEAKAVSGRAMGCSRRSAAARSPSSPASPMFCDPVLGHTVRSRRVHISRHVHAERVH